MMREPLLLTYRRPSNSCFLRNKQYYTYFTNDVDGHLMIYTSTEKKPIDGPFFLEDFYYPEDEASIDILTPSDITLDNFQQFVKFYDEYWMEQLEEQAYYCQLAKNAIIEANIERLGEIFKNKLDVNQEYYYDIKKRPMNILGFFIDYFFNNDFDDEAFIACILMLFKDLEVDPRLTYLEPDTRIIESIFRLYLEDLYKPHFANVAFLIGVLIDNGADYQFYYKDKHCLVQIAQMLSEDALSFINDVNDRITISYVEISFGSQSYYFIIPGEFLDDNQFSPQKYNDFVCKLRSFMLENEEIEIVKKSHFTLYANVRYPEWIELIENFYDLPYLDEEDEDDDDWVGMRAIDCGYDKQLKTYLDDNRDFLFKYHNGENLVWLALEMNLKDNKKIPRILNILKQYGYDFNNKDSHNLTIIIYLALMGKYWMVRHLLNLGVDIETVCDEWTLLEALAIKFDVELFIDVYNRLDGDNYRCAHKGRTLLHSACIGNNHQVILFLLDKGYDVNAIDKLGVTPLLVALITEKENYHAISTILASDKVDLGFRHLESMDTYLHCAIRSGRPYRVKLILDYFNEVNIKNGSGEYPLDLLAKLALYPTRIQDVVDIYKMLITRGAECANSRNEEILGAVIDNYYRPSDKKSQKLIEVVQVLIDGCDYLLTCQYGDMTKLHIGDRVLISRGKEQLVGYVVSKPHIIERSMMPMFNGKNKIIAKL